MNLRDQITQGEWKADGRNILVDYGDMDFSWICLDVRCGFIDKPDSGTEEANSKAIAQLPNLLGLVDILSQRLEEKYKDTPEDKIPMDELNELLACRKIREAILN